MIEKKSLNFDFLDENPIITDEKVGTPGGTPIQTTKIDKVNFFQYFRACYSNFNRFSEENLVIKSPKYLLVAIWIMGMGNAADRLTSSSSSNWGETWAIVIFGGIFAGVIAYYIAGWFYHIRVLWSKGSGDMDTARNIYTFTSLPISVVAIGSLIFNQMAYGSDYFYTYSSNASTVDIIASLLIFVAIVYSTYISYRAVVAVMHAQNGRAIVWFIIAPALFYFAIFGSTLFG